MVLEITWLTFLPGQAPLVERLGGVRAEPDRLGEGLAQPRLHMGFHRCVGVGDLLGVHRHGLLKMAEEDDGYLGAIVFSADSDKDGK
ncbi:MULTISPECIES: hypothetical protein [unclassified Nonomuraea]|uniref:hypothetical protein n=1 Tax=unclassified Nonomuraea TaxID=2593643 RepID=UPI003410C052